MKAVLSFILTFLSLNLIAQDWELAKETDDVKVYTKEVEGDPLKYYKAETTFQCTAAEFIALMFEIDKYPDWVEGMESVEELDRTDEEVHYYALIELPWPLSDRDMVAVMTLENLGSGKYRMSNLPADKHKVDEKDDIVRLTNFREEYTISEKDGVCSVMVEGKFDLQGNVPLWVTNMFVVDGPVQSFDAMRKELKP